MHPPDLLPNLLELSAVNLCHLCELIEHEIDLRRSQLEQIGKEMIRRSNEQYRTEHPND